MAAVDDIYNQITRDSRKRNGRSFFPAANAINSTPQGQTLIAGRGKGYDPNQDSRQMIGDAGYSSNATLGSGRASAATTQNYINTYGFDAGGGNVGVYLPSGGFASVRRSTRTLSGGLPAGGNAPFSGGEQSGYPSSTPTAPPISYGSQVGFSMLSNVPSAPTIPAVTARPYEAPPAPLTTSERIGRTASNVLNFGPSWAQVGNAASSIGRGIYGIGRDIYGGFTGNRAQQPPPSEMGAGSTPVTNPMTPNPWGNAFWNRGLPSRFSDVQPKDYFAQ